MNKKQKAYFREKLSIWRDDILRESRETLQSLQDENICLPDLADRASTETDRALELRTRDRQRKLIAKIESALKRIDEGSYERTRGSVVLDDPSGIGCDEEVPVRTDRHTEWAG